MRLSINIALLDILKKQYCQIYYLLDNIKNMRLSNIMKDRGIVYILEPPHLFLYYC